MSRQKQLLTVWNPYYEPHVIQAHAEILRRQTAGHRVWWARLYMGKGRFDEAGAREKYPHVATLADEAAAEARDLVLYVTNYQVLHALRVERIVFGAELDPAETAFAPSYYRQREIPFPAIWFLVRDIRALAFNQMDTLRYFHESGELSSGVSGYDPYAAFYHPYPIVVEAPSVEEIFDPKGLRGKARLYADHPETIFAPEIAVARKELEKVLDGVWDRLEDKSQAFLATSWVIYGQHQHTRDFDLSAAFSGIARAVETEICEGVVEPYVQIVKAELGEAGWRRRFEREPKLTLGSVRPILKETAEVALKLRLPEIWRLNGDHSWSKWLRDFVSIRNDASHVKPLSKSRVRQRLEEILAPRGETRLEPVVAAKERIRAHLRAQAAEQPIDLGPLLERFGKAR